MHKKTFTFLVILYPLFVIALIFSTNVVLSIPQRNVFRVQKAQISEFDDLSNNLSYKIDTFIANQDIFYTVEFIGWAFLQDEQDTSDQQIKLIFISEENRYEVETQLQERFDLRQVFIENHISGYKHGFITKFSTLPMKNGIYKLYLYCYENDNTFGMVDTGRMYVKTYRSFSAYNVNP